MDSYEMIFEIVEERGAPFLCCSVFFFFFFFFWLFVCFFWGLFDLFG